MCITPRSQTQQRWASPREVRLRRVHHHAKSDSVVCITTRSTKKQRLPPKWKPAPLTCVRSWRNSWRPQSGRPCHPRSRSCPLSWGTRCWTLSAVPGGSGSHLTRRRRRKHEQHIKILFSFQSIMAYCRNKHKKRGKRDWVIAIIQAQNYAWLLCNTGSKSGSRRISVIFVDPDSS